MRVAIHALVVLGLLTCFQAAAIDGTEEGPVANPQAPGEVGSLVQVDTNRYVVTPFESVSISQSSTWQDNRLRAYYSTSLGNVSGFLLFDVTDIPDTDCVTGMTLRCYLEDAYGSPASNPVVDVYYSGDDNWTRMTAAPGSLSLDELLVDDVPFTVYIPFYDFVLDVAAHDWSVDLLDNRICIGLTDDVTYYSYVYFFGAYGSPTGPPPELTIETSAGPSPVEPKTWGEIKSLYR